MDSRDFPRSSLQLSPARSALLVVDLQQRLLPVIPTGQSIAWNACRLLQAANTFGIPHLVTEQYPEKLGTTIESLLPHVSHQAAKRMFSCIECASELAELLNGRDQLLVCGIETHVCVLQTVLDLLDRAKIHLVIDALGSRKTADHECAVQQMLKAGVTPVTAESVLFQWCETSTHPDFKLVSSLVRPLSPPSA